MKKLDNFKITSCKLTFRDDRWGWIIINRRVTGILFRCVSKHSLSSVAAPFRGVEKFNLKQQILFFTHAAQILGDSKYFKSVKQLSPTQLQQIAIEILHDDKVLNEYFEQELSTKIITMLNLTAIIKFNSALPFQFSVECINRMNDYMDTPLLIFQLTSRDLNNLKVSTLIREAVFLQLLGLTPSSLQNVRSKNGNEGADRIQIPVEIDHPFLEGFTIKLNLYLNQRLFQSYQILLQTDLCQAFQKQLMSSQLEH